MTAPEIPHMTYQQCRAARRLVRECCNYDCGNCLLLDDGEECVCPQGISYSLICKWFRTAVLEFCKYELRGGSCKEYQDGPVKIGLNQQHPTARGALV